MGDPPDAGPAFDDVVWMIGFSAFVIGVVLFAIGTVQANVLPARRGH